MSAPAVLRRSGARYQAWRAFAACRDADPDLFTGADGEKARQCRQREAAAKAVCAACPVTAECLADGKAAGDRFSVRGGLAPGERGYPAQPGVPDGHKFCRGCGTPKPAADFAADRTKPGGKRSRCRACCTSAQTARNTRATAIQPEEAAALCSARREPASATGGTAATSPGAGATSPPGPVTRSVPACPSTGTGSTRQPGARTGMTGAPAAPPTAPWLAARRRMAGGRLRRGSGPLAARGDPGEQAGQVPGTAPR